MCLGLSNNQTKGMVWEINETLKSMKQWKQMMLNVCGLCFHHQAARFLVQCGFTLCPTTRSRGRIPPPFRWVRKEVVHTQASFQGFANWHWPSQLSHDGPSPLKRSWGCEAIHNAAHIKTIHCSCLAWTLFSTVSNADNVKLLLFTKSVRLPIYANTHKKALFGLHSLLF